MSLCQLAEGPDTQMENLQFWRGRGEATCDKKSPYSPKTHRFMHHHSHTRAHAHTSVPLRSRLHAPALMLICLETGAASDGAGRWTAFEPATSVTHPYWWQSEHSLPTQRFSEHSVAPGTAGISGVGGSGSRFWQESRENHQFICKGAKTKPQLEVVFGE